MTWKILILLAVVGSLWADPIQAQQTPSANVSSHNVILSTAIASVLVGPFGAAGGMWYRWLLTQQDRTTILESQTVCQDLQRPGTQKLLAASAMLALMPLYGIRAEVLGRGNNLAAWTGNTIFSYLGGAIGARLTVHWLCQREKLWSSLNIMAVAAIATGLVAALGANLIW